MSSDVRVGVDIGGTFTDLVTIADGRVQVHKTPSTPENAEVGVLDGLESVAATDGIDRDSIGFFAHGTTVATNAVLEREWAETALVTTEGFRDVLEIGRQARPAIYDFQAEKPTPIVERDRRYEVTERLDERGRVQTPLDEASVEALVDDLDDVDSIAVSLLYSFENDAHERRVKEVLEDAGVDASFSLSADVLPEIREYERTLTTALNGALKPVMNEYIGRLESRIADAGVTADLKIMQSNGGIITADAARDRPVNTLLSGPAGGVQGATYVSSLAGIDDCITMDMGGTSCDVSLVQDGDPLVTMDVEVGDYPVSVPMIDIHTVGAGGGSIAWIDAGGALRVGPKSAGAQPGPVCYGRGGTKPTITDAQAVLGRIDPGRFLDGPSPDDAVEAAIVEHVADPLDMDVTEAAQGILDVANANMARALRVVSVERGYDPREFGLVAFGGAGPLHAGRLARELEIPRVVVPRTAGVLSALGLLISDVLYDFSTSKVRPWSDVDPATLADPLATFRERGARRLAAEDDRADVDVPADDDATEPRSANGGGTEKPPADGVATDPSAADAGAKTGASRSSIEHLQYERSVDVRYAGQSFELTVPVPDGEIDGSTLDTVEERFHAKHRRRYGHAYADEPIELVTVRLRARGVVETPDLRPEPVDGGIDDAVRETRAVGFDGRTHDTAVYARGAIPTGASVDGPAIVEGAESTVVVHPEQTASVDEYGSLVVEVDA